METWLLGIGVGVVVMLGGTLDLSQLVLVELRALLGRGGLGGAQCLVALMIVQLLG